MCYVEWVGSRKNVTFSSEKQNKGKCFMQNWGHFVTYYGQFFPNEKKLLEDSEINTIFDASFLAKQRLLFT